MHVKPLKCFRIILCVRAKSVGGHREAKLSAQTERGEVARYSSAAGLHYRRASQSSDSPVSAIDLCGLKLRLIM